MTENDVVYVDPLLKMMIYGTPGCGKTTLVGTAAEVEALWPVLYLNAKGNPHVLRHLKNRPDVITIRRMVDFNEPYKWLSDGQDPKDPFAVDLILHPPYKTLVVDAITEVQRHVVRRVVQGETTRPGDLLPLLGRQGFGQLLGTMLNWADAFVELPMNVILVSHEAKGSSDNSVAPLLWGQSGMEICSQVLLVMRLVTKLAMPANITAKVSKDLVYNVGQVLETVSVYAKDQYDMGTTYIEDPTMQKVMTLIEQGSQSPNPKP